MRLSLIDRTWLRMEQPTNLMMIGGLIFFDEPLDLSRLRHVLDVRLAGMHPQFRHAISQPALGAPRWRRTRFDVRDHLHCIALPAPGGDDELAAVVGDLMSSPLDPSRPLWDVHYIERFPGLRSVLLIRIHHALGDGTALVEALLDITDSGPEVHHRARHAGAQRRSAAARLAAYADPRVMARQLFSAAESGLTLVHLALLWPDPATPLRGTLGHRKQVAWSRPITIADTAPLRARLGCTVNDVMVTAVAGALRDHLIHHQHHSPSRLRALVPVDMRSSDTEKPGTNYFGLVFLDLPVGVADRLERLAAVHDRMDEARRSPQPSVALDVLAVLGLGNTVLQRLVTRFFGSKATAVVSNVRGPAHVRYIAGAPMRTMLFLVPQSAELSLGISIYGYAGEIRVGVIADAGLVHDPAALVHGIEREVEALLIHDRPARPAQPLGVTRRRARMPAKRTRSGRKPLRQTR